MSDRPLQLIIANAKDNEMLAQKFFKHKRKVEKVRYEFTGNIAKALIISYVPKENSIVLFVE